MKHLTLSLKMPALLRQLNRNTAIAIVIGGVIGSGIFMKPSLMAAQLQSPVLLMTVWVVAGLITLFGALSTAEVAAMFPETGGQYVFFQKMYGEGFAFLYGWAAFAVFNTAGNASIAYVFSQYTNYLIELPRFNDTIEQSWKLHIPFIGNFYPLQQIGIKLLTVFVVLTLTFISYKSVIYGGRLQRLLTALKALAILVLIGSIFFSGKGSVSHFTIETGSGKTGWEMVMLFMAALSGAFWAYDGWNNISFVAGEIKEPQKNIPLSLLFGLGFCMLVYVLINLAFVYLMPINVLAASSFVASDAATIAWGAIGGIAITLMVMLFVLGATNANILATARVTFAMGTHNKMFRVAGKIHPRFQTPGNALWINAIWSIVLIFSGSFDMLTDMLIFVTWFFYGMSAIGVFVLRKKLTDTPRAYKVWGYPLVPFIFILFTAFFLISTLYNDIDNYLHGRSPVINSVLGLIITLSGLPLYFLARRKRYERADS
ncbi:MAG: APC family permease [Sediminibacterium sp.]